MLHVRGFRGPQAGTVAAGPTEAADPEAADPAQGPVVVVGGGPVGLRVVQELLQRTARDIVLLSDERWAAYNRVKLTPLLAGDIQIGQIYQPLTVPPGGRLRHYLAHHVVALDRAARCVRDHRGRLWPYQTLVLATGSRAHVPNIPGVARDGVFAFRGIDNVEALVARSFSSRRTVVIGGGLLGLEAARGMARRGVPVLVVEHEDRLMARQLDGGAGALLKAAIESLGIEVRVATAVREILGDSRVEGIRLAGDAVVACDTIILCTGIRPNKELARAAGLRVGAGIWVDDHLRTSDPAIYAVGECAEHDGVVHGLVGPGIEQAAVAARHIADGTGRYRGSIPTTRLKVVGTPVFSMGETGHDHHPGETASHVFRTATGYRRLILREGRLAGALAVGAWPDLNRLQSALVARAPVYPWQLRRFRRSGQLWPADADASVVAWPAAATVCNCTGVTRGQLGAALAAGCSSVAGLQEATGAGTVCGSCQTHLAVLAGGAAAPAPAPNGRGLMVVAVLGLALLAVILMAGPYPNATSFAATLPIDQLWLDGTFKQISGFLLLGLGLAAALLSLRKRWTRLRFGSFGLWRLVHGTLGVALVLVLGAHTGLRFGVHLNFWLQASVLAATLAGLSLAAVIALEHRLARAGPGTVRVLRQGSLWGHLVACWPLPVLLLFHILSVYFF